jgi:Transcriptional Coactivator p15 (PC4)
MNPRVILPEPIEWRLWRTRWRRDAVVVSISTFEDRNLFGVRIYTTSTDGKMLPTTKGIAINIERLPELHAAVTHALKKARELGLIPDDGGGE